MGVVNVRRLTISTGIGLLVASALLIVHHLGQFRSDEETGEIAEDSNDQRAVQVFERGPISSTLKITTESELLDALSKKAKPLLDEIDQLEGDPYLVSLQRNKLEGDLDDLLDEFLSQCPDEIVISLAESLTTEGKYPGTVALSIFRRWGFLEPHQAMVYFFDHCDFEEFIDTDDPFSDKNIVKESSSLWAVDPRFFYTAVFQGVCQTSPDVALDVWKQQYLGYKGNEVFESYSVSVLQEIGKGLAEKNSLDALQIVFGEEDLGRVKLLLIGYVSAANSDAEWESVVTRAVELSSKLVSKGGFEEEVLVPVLSGWARNDLNQIGEWYGGLNSDERKEVDFSFGATMYSQFRTGKEGGIELVRRSAQNSRPRVVRGFIYEALEQVMMSGEPSGIRLAPLFVSLITDIPDRGDRNEAVKSLVRVPGHSAFVFLDENNNVRPELDQLRELGVEVRWIERLQDFSARHKKQRKESE